MHKIKLCPIQGLDELNTMKEEEALSFVNEIRANASIASWRDMNSLEIPKKSSLSFVPCLVSSRHLQPLGLAEKLQDNGASLLDFREYLTVTKSLNTKPAEASNVILYANEYINFANDSWSALRFSKEKSAVGSGFWWTQLCFVEHQNYFLTEEYSEWHIACKYITPI